MKVITKLYKKQNMKTYKTEENFLKINVIFGKKTHFAVLIIHFKNSFCSFNKNGKIKQNSKLTFKKYKKKL